MYVPESEVAPHRKKAKKGSNKVCKAGTNKGKPHEYTDKQVFSTWHQDGMELQFGYMVCVFCGKHGPFWQNYDTHWHVLDSGRSMMDFTLKGE